MLNIVWITTVFEAEKLRVIEYFQDGIQSFF